LVIGKAVPRALVYVLITGSVALHQLIAQLVRQRAVQEAVNARPAVEVEASLDGSIIHGHLFHGLFLTELRMQI
jgi:hypothetical protein